MRIANSVSTERAAKKALFELIENKEHWKKPIHALIPINKFNDFNQAVIYFHGEGIRVVSESDGFLEVKNSGYTCW